jgi:hypothetical protein
MVCFLVHYYCEGGMCKLLCQVGPQSFHFCTFLLHQRLYRVIEGIIFFSCLTRSSVPYGTQLSPVSFALKLSSCIHCMKYDVNKDHE